MKCLESKGGKFIILSMLFIFPLILSSALAASVQSNPTNDAYVNHNSPTTNYGSDTYMAVRSDATSKARNTFLKFTVSGVTGTVTAAKLKMYSQNVTQSVTAKAVSDTSWTEGAITWNNQPTIGSTLDTNTPSASSWVEFEVKDHVTGNGTYSLCLQGSIDSGQSFDSKENTNKPVLEVTYDTNDTTPPAAPTGLGATPGDTQVSLDWNDNTEGDLSHYNVSRSTTQGGPHTEIATDVTVSDYNDTGLTNDTTYYYVVTAVDTNDNESSDSSEVSATPTAGGGGTLEFNPTDDAYVNHNSPTTNYGSDNYLAVRSDATSKARNSFLKFTVSGVSGTVTAAKLKLYSQNVTQSVTAKVSGTSWTEGAITWNNQPTPGSTLDTKAPSASSWVEFDVVSHVTGNGTYAFCLQGSIDSGQSFTSKEGTNKPVLVVTYGEGDTTPPAAPTGLGATPGDTQVSLDWNDNTEGDLSHYNVSRSTTQGGPHTEIATDVTTSAYTNTGLTNNTTYYYVVTAVDTNDNESSDSSEVSATPQDTTAPAAPTGLGATAGDTQVSLDWNDNTEGDLSHYHVSRSTTQGGPHTEIASNVTVSDYNDTGLTNDTTYYYVVSAVDDSSNESSDSSEVSATPTAGGGGSVESNPTDDAYVNHNLPTTNYGSDNYMAVRSDATSKARNTFLKFTVSGVSGTVTAAKLKLYSQSVTQSVTAKAVSNTSWTEGAITWNNQPTIGSTLDTKSPSASSWVEFDVASHVSGNGTYSFCLQGSIDSGQSFTSKEGTNKPILEVTYGGGDTTAPAAPTGLTRTIGDTEVSLDWDDNTESDLSYYVVYRDTSSGGPYTEIAANLTTSKYTDTGLTNNTTYYYVVAAVDTSENESIDSIEVSAKPQAPQYARPSSDKSNPDSWTATPLYAKIDEVTVNNSNYILSPALPVDVDKICEVWLSTVTDPGDYTGNENHILSYVFRTAIGGAPTSGPRKLVVSLYQDGVSDRIAGWADTKPLTETQWTRRDRYIPVEKASLITDYSKLYFSIKAVGLTSSSENVGVSWAQLQVPPAKKTAPTAPSSLSRTVISDKQINLSWTDNSGNEDGFIIERKLTSGGTWERLYPKTGPNVESYSARVAPSTNYTFRVCAYNTGGDSSYTSTVSGTSQSHTGTSYYVATTGDDGDAGTIGAPFATIQKGVDMLSAGDTLYIRGGTYNEKVKLVALTGTSSNRIVIRNYESEVVTLDGTEEITSSWSVHSGNIYKTTLSKDIWQLFVDGKMMTPARWPNADNPMATNSNHWNRDQTWADMDESQARADHMYHTGSPTLASTGKSFQGGMAILNTGGWNTFAKVINSHSSGSNNFTHDHVSTFGRGLSHARYYIECDLDCLDAAEEWFYNPSTKVLYLYAAGGVDPDTLNNIRGKRQNYAMELDYCEYLTIRGLKFYGNTLCSDDSRQLIINKCIFTYPSFRPTMLGIPSNPKESDEYYFLQHYEGQTYIYHNTPGTLTQNVVKNCTFEYTDGPGLDMNKGKEDVIENCYFQYIDFSGLGQTSVIMQQNPDSVFRRNTIHTTSASETFRIGLRGLTEYNHGWYTGNLQSDGGLYQLRWENQNGAIVRYNWARDTIKVGVRFDGPKTASTNINGLVHHNVAINCGNQGIQMKGDQHKVYCNTAIDAAGTEDIELRRHPLYPTENANSITRNNVCGVLSVVGTHDHNWSGGDETAQMRDTANLDFRPTSGSAIRDAGAVISGITTGYLGSAPDIGAYEYGCTSYWIPGCKFEKTSTPVPPDGATGVKRACDPAWLEALDATSYDIYLGTSSPGTFIKNQSSNLYDRSSDLSANTTYYWRIDAVTPGGTITGDVWSFTTGSN